MPFLQPYLGCGGFAVTSLGVGRVPHHPPLVSPKVAPITQESLHHTLHSDPTGMGSFLLGPGLKTSCWGTCLPRITAGPGPSSHCHSHCSLARRRQSSRSSREEARSTLGFGWDTAFQGWTLGHHCQGRAPPIASPGWLGAVLKGPKEGGGGEASSPALPRKAPLLSCTNQTSAQRSAL